MANFIPVDRSKNLGAALLQAATDARRLAYEIGSLQSIMAGMVDGTDTTMLEAQFGIPAGKGGDVSYLVAQLKAGLDSIAQFKLLSDWFGQM